MWYPLHTVILDNSQAFRGVPCRAQLCNFSKWFLSPRFGVVPIWKLWQFWDVRKGAPKSGAEDRIVVALAALSIVYSLRISEAASIRSIDLVQEEAFIRFYDFKCKDKWVKRPAGVYVCRLIGFMRLQTAIQGRKVALPLFKGGARKLGQAMANLLRETEFKDLRWHCWRRTGATMFTRAGGSMCELMAWGR